jgi:hypothetical protein
MLCSTGIAQHTIQGGLHEALMAAQVDEAQHMSCCLADLCWCQRRHTLVIQYAACGGPRIASDQGTPAEWCRLQ